MAGVSDWEGLATYLLHHLVPTPLYGLIFYQWCFIFHASLNGDNPSMLITLLMPKHGTPSLFGQQKGWASSWCNKGNCFFNSCVILWLTVWLGFALLNEVCMFLEPWHISGFACGTWIVVQASYECDLTLNWFAWFQALRACGYGRDGFILVFWFASGCDAVVWFPFFNLSFWWCIFEYLCPLWCENN